MQSDSVRFDRFVLNAQNRLLLADGVPVELSARYLDALVLMVREAGGWCPRSALTTRFGAVCR